jgi:hypothetical protein
VALLVSSRAAADDPLRASMAWEQLGAALHLGVSSLVPHNTAAGPVGEDTTSASRTSWLGTEPHLSIVARDWGVSQLLWGHLTVADQLRLSRSSRMGLGRLRLGGGLVAPFVQVGVGQWRADSRVLAWSPAETELAGQLGGGFEVAVAPRAVVALQGDCTLLVPEGREPQALAPGHLWSALLAARARF